MKENKISIEITADGWKTDVTINGKTYSERHIGHYGSSECVEGNFEEDLSLIHISEPTRP